MSQLDMISYQTVLFVGPGKKLYRDRFRIRQELENNLNFRSKMGF